jgi:hypothetical protein
MAVSSGRAPLFLRGGAAVREHFPHGLRQCFAKTPDVLFIIKADAAHREAVPPSQRAEGLRQFVLSRNLSPFHEDRDDAGAGHGESRFHFDSDVIAGIVGSPVAALVGAARPFPPNEYKDDWTAAQGLLDIGRKIDPGGDRIDVTKDRRGAEIRRQRIVNAIHHLLAVGAAVAQKD